jgi:ribosomal protein S18 acetylase RimI-like enzyme
MACPPSISDEAVQAFIDENLSEARFTEYLADRARAILIAEVDGQARGYTMLLEAEPHATIARLLTARPTIEINKVYVDREMQGTGLGSALMASTLATAAQRGAVGAWLGVNKLNERALRFYIKSGFSIIGSRTFSVGGSPQDDHVMEFVFD